MAKQSGHKGKSTAETAEALILPVLEELGLTLWDVRFEKEGSAWYLRYFIDKDGDGINMKELEAATKAIDKILDEADPINQSYMLEVGSPGVERQLTRDWHFEACMGQLVQVRMIRPVEGIRDFTGALSGFENGSISILLGNGEEEVEMTFTKKETAYIKLYVNFDC